ncbi:MAG: hypothetical protein M1431_01465 [Candidatus Thermoplasmatota archaeon]|nr:hypothetical protein [Candidatus Thermoplasmatota archaeon]
MNRSPVRMDLAFYNGKKGTLKLFPDSLEFTGWKGTSASWSIDQVQEVSFVKTATTTSTLYINGNEITVCRAHLWAGDINKILKKS